jgi:hypothetical protein
MICFLFIQLLYTNPHFTIMQLLWHDYKNFSCVTYACSGISIC